MTFKENIPVTRQVFTDEINIKDCTTNMETDDCYDDGQNTTSGKKRSSLDCNAVDSGIDSTTDVTNIISKEVSRGQDESVEPIQNDGSCDENQTENALPILTKNEEQFNEVKSDKLNVDMENDDAATHEKGKNSSKSTNSDDIVENDIEDALSCHVTAPPIIDLQRPVKRARSAYFLFLEDHRIETQKQVRCLVIVGVRLCVFGRCDQAERVTNLPHMP
jgi:hypothetical protein